jgi:putative ABC transport system permease protein
MSPLATLRIALLALRINKLRSALTMLGIIIGVAAVIIMIAVGRGAQLRVQDQIRSLGSNIVMVLNGTNTSGGARGGAGSQPTIFEEDAYALGREIEEVQAAAPTLRGSGQVVFGNANWSTVFYGTTTDYLTVREWGIAEGRPFEDAEMSGAGKVALIGQTVANSLFGDANPVDQVIRIRKVPLTVIGVLERKGQNMMGQDQDDIVLMPLSTARNRIMGNPASPGKSRNISSIMVKMRDGPQMDQGIAHMRELLRQRHRLQDDQDDDFYVRNLSEILEAQEAASKVMAMLLAAVASVSLLVGGIGIMNIMLVSVTERTREIGLRMAVGARGRDILLQFLVEAVTLSLIGGLLGIALGIGGQELIARFAGWPTVLSLDAMLLAAGFAAFVGVFFGYYPARKAASLSPIDALRYE